MRKNIAAIASKSAPPAVFDTSRLNVDTLGAVMPRQWVHFSVKRIAPTIIPVFLCPESFALEVRSVFYSYTDGGGAGGQVPGVSLGYKALTYARVKSIVAMGAGQTWNVSGYAGQPIQSMFGNFLQVPLPLVVIPPGGFITPDISNDTVNDTCSEMIVTGWAIPKA